MNPLFKYFEENWNRQPYPVIDHALRIDRRGDGTFHFYIHPANTDGTTTDVVVSSDAITPLTPEQEAKQELTASKEGWIHRSLVAFDQMVNVILFRGQPGETISTHSARADRLGKSWGKVMSRFLDLFQSDHGAKARAGDIERAKNLLRIETSW